MLDDFVRRPSSQPDRPRQTAQTIPTPQPSSTPAPASVRDSFQPTQLDQMIATAKQTGEMQPPPRDRNPLTAVKRWWLQRSKKQKILILLAAIIVIAGSGAAYALVFNKPAPEPAPKISKAVPKPKVAAPTTVASLLSGRQVAPAVNTRPVTGVMIENSVDARPQAGLKDASIVFEAIAEGGITRFLALYQDTQPDYVGPVRSARPYYVQWAQGFDAGYAHVGGSPEALSDIKANGVKDLDQFYNGSYYQRITSRYAPHNVYTSLNQLVELQTAKGYPTSTFTAIPRKTASASKAPSARSINFDISSAAFAVHYDYTAACNCYARSEGGAVHKDDKSGQQLTPDVVIAMVMDYGLEADDHHSRYNVIGSGEAYVFQDGIVTKGTWAKADAKSQVTFTDAAGKAIQLNPGQTWITALAGGNELSYQ